MFVTQAAGRKIEDGYTITIDRSTTFPPQKSAVVGKLLDALHAKSIKIAPKLLSSKIEGVTQLENYKGVDLWVTFNSGETVVGDQLTFGQKRFLVICFLLMQNTGNPYIIDELDNGFHPEFTKLIMDLTSDHQAFYASHDTLLINSINFHSPKDIEEKMHFCKRFDGGHVGIVEIEKKKAENIFKKIAAGISRPSDIFDDEHLW